MCRKQKILKLKSFCKGPTKNWIAVEGSPSHSGPTDSIPLANYSYKIASSAPKGPQSTDERNVFAIYVSYYIKVKLALSGMGGEVTLKLPFILGHIDDSLDDNQDHDDVEKKLDNKIDSNAIVSVATAGTCTTTDDDDVNSKATIGSMSLGDVNSGRKKCDDVVTETGANGIEKCRNENGLSIDVIVEDLSDRKNDVNNGSTVVVGSSTSQQPLQNYSNDNERNINVVTAQIHSSAV